MKANLTSFNATLELHSVKRWSNKDIESDKFPAAVVVRNAEKSYWRDVPVIKNLNMTIKQGTIYSLLGSSGCGKSTTLSCIVGLAKLNSGHVWVFGKKPCGGQGVPGKSVGYMPQDCSLHDDFTREETMTYYGVLNGMDKYQIMHAIVFYTNLLKIPIESQRVGSFSGGQKRRLSFAVALMHNPELLILDEPTVGVDPLLRESIWKHLLKLSQDNCTTVLITTHYVEEARWSNMVGVMRDGQLLAEKSPQALLKQYKASSLETVILQLCREGVEEETLWTPMPDPLSMAVITRKQDSVAVCVSRIFALIQKNMFWMLRNYTFLMMMIILPVFSTYMHFISMGLNPHHINFGVVNKELHNGSSSCYELRHAWNKTCDLNFWSCKFLSYLPHDTFILKKFTSKELAKEAVKLGEIRGFIHFPEEFSWEFYEREANGLNTDPMLLNDSSIVVRLDQSNKIITQQIQFNLYSAFEKLIKSVFEDCGYNSSQAENPLRYKDPIVGNTNLTVQNYIMPGVCLMQLFYWPIVSTGIRFVNEKRQGTMERSLVAGVSMWEVFLAYSVTELATTVVQQVLMYAMAVLMFDISVQGSLWLIFLLGTMAGFAGVAAGFLIGSFCTEEIQVALISMAILIPNMTLSGLIWPIEGMIGILRNISYYLPCTLATEAMRSITNRGWDLTHPNVWHGFVAIFMHMMIYFVLAMGISTMKFIK